jgi:hypothetical protein
MKQLLVICIFLSTNLAIADNSKKKFEWCSREDIALKVAKAGLLTISKDSTEVEGITVTYKTKKDETKWKVIRTDSKMLDGSNRIEISKKNCAILGFFPQTDEWN